MTTKIKTTDLQARQEDGEIEPSTFAGFMAATNVANLDLGQADDVLSGDDKEVLVGVPFIVTGWDHRDWDTGPGISLECLTEDNRRLVVNDGSTGIFRQMHDIEHSLGGVHPFLVSHGLRRSEFHYDPKTGKAQKRGEPGYGTGPKATTYFLDIRRAK